MLARHKPSLLLDTILPFVASASVTALLYGASLSYEFLFDAPFDIPRATGRSFWSILTYAGDISYYRPLGLLIWKALYEVLGRNSETILHLLVLLPHAVSGWLVYVLGARLGGRIAGWLSALLFLSYPLSYQVLGNVNTSKPLVTVFLLGAVAAYWNWREHRQLRWLAVAIVSGICAVFSHEYGVVLVALIGAAEAVWLLSKGGRRPSVALLIFAFISLSFFLIWWNVPKGDHQWQLDPESLGLNTLFLVQGLVYPIAGYLAPRLQLEQPYLALLLLSLGGLLVALMAALYRSSRRLPALGFALAWTVLGFLPALISLPFSYVVDGPRLLYLSSVGISLAWGGLLASAFRWRGFWLRLASGTAALAVGALIVLQGAAFIVERNHLYEMGASMVSALGNSAVAPERTGRTYVNFPSWLGYRETRYFIMHTGVSMVPDYIGLSRVVYTRNGQQPEINSLTYEPVRTDWAYYCSPHGPKAGLAKLEEAFRQGGGVYLTRLHPDSLSLDYVGEVLPAGASQGPYLAQFDGWARLVSADLVSKPGAVDLTLRWEATGTTDLDYTMFAQVLDAGHNGVAQLDGYPIGQMFPPRRWRAGDVIIDRRLIELPPAALSGTHQVVVGIYDRQSGKRAKATSPSGVPWSEDAVIVANITMP